jgi:hypothetical protein
LKCKLATYIISRCGLLRRLHRGAAAVATGEAAGLPHQGLTLLLALVVSVGDVGPGEWRSRRSGRGRVEQEQEQEQE